MIPRSSLLLAVALDKSQDPLTRERAWLKSDLEFWYESVVYRKLPLLAAPECWVRQIRQMMFDRHEGPITGTQLRK